MQKTRLLSHSNASESLQEVLERIIARIKAEGDKPHVTVKQQLEFLMQLSQFDFGKFLLKNGGINGYWTHYMLTYPWWKKNISENKSSHVLTELEQQMLEKAPAILATQQRFTIFLQENQKAVKNNATLGCIPCGMMGELFYLDFKDIKSIRLIGIDYDIDAIENAKMLSEEKNLLGFSEFVCADAWSLNINNEFDLISSNGLNIYEPDDEKIIQLYEKFYGALKPGGRLVASFLTPPPTLTDACEWDTSKLQKEDLLLQRIIFSDIIGAKWQCFRSTKKTEEQLKSAGFNNITFIYDDAQMFPTVTAVK